MRYQLGLYGRMIGIHIRSQIQYRANFVFEAISTAITAIIGFGSLALILNRFDSITGWSLGEIAFLYGTVETSFGLMDMFFSGFDPQNFGRQVRLGRLDQLMLRPVSITFQVIGSEFILRRVGRIGQGIFILALAISLQAISWSPIKILFMPVVILSMLCFFGGLFIFGATITIWTYESIELINIFTYGGSEMISYPMHIYQKWFRDFFTYIIPAIFLNYYPTLYILGKPDILNMPSYAPFLSPLVGLATLALSLAFWNYGLRYYQSTGT